MARRLAAVAWVALLVTGVLGLARGGEGGLAPPPLAPDEWVAWAGERTALEASAAVLRLVALVAASYLLAVTVLGLVAGALRRRHAVAVVARWSPGIVRWLLGAWLAGTLAVAPAGSAPAAGTPPTMVLLPEDEPSTTTTTGAPAAPAPAPPPVPADTTITLAPGDHLWSVAARTLATAWGRPPAEREVAPYWRLVVELNRAELPNPADPDLVFPGDVLRLPPVPR